MKASETKFQPIIEGTKQYVVPLFQRPYLSVRSFLGWISEIGGKFGVDALWAVQQTKYLLL